MESLAADDGPCGADDGPCVGLVRPCFLALGDQVEGEVGGPVSPGDFEGLVEGERRGARMLAAGSGLERRLEEGARFVGQQVEEGVALGENEKRGHENVPRGRGARRSRVSSPRRGSRTRLDRRPSSPPKGPGDTSESARSAGNLRSATSATPRRPSCGLATAGRSAYVFQ